jgi:outer membrane protein assembly factor BamB
LTPLTRDWAGFRGTEDQDPGPGVVTGTYPTEWDEDTLFNIAWGGPVSIPLPGASSPVVCGDRIFLTGADGTTREVYCFSTTDGSLLWQKGVAPSGSQTQTVAQDFRCYAVPTVAMDGTRVFALFGNGDIACFDYNGNQKWAKSLGLPDITYGHSSSLTLYGTLLIVQLDQANGNTKLLALRTSDGGTSWQKTVANRPVTKSWSTPIIINVAGSDQLVTRGGDAGSDELIAYNPVTGGAALWTADLETAYADMASSPVYVDGKVMVVASLGGQVAVKAFDPTGTGTLSASWTSAFTPSVDDCPSPVGSSGKLYFVTGTGDAQCINTANGSSLWAAPQALGASFYASPALVNDLVYALAQSGTMHIFKDVTGTYTPTGGTRSLTTATDFWPSPAFVNGCIYIRGADGSGNDYLYCIKLP